MNTPTCGPTSPVRKAVIDIAVAGVNQTKLAAATTYVEAQIDPIVTLISDDVSSVISNNYLVLLFIVLVAVIAIVLWVCAVLRVERGITLGIVLLLIFVAGVAFLAFRSYARSAVERALRDVVSSITTQITGPELVYVLNGAARQYLGINC